MAKNNKNSSANNTQRKSTMAKAQSRVQQNQRKNNSKKSKNSKNSKSGIKEYFKGVKLEMKKVVWPTKQELGSFTAIVLCTCAAFALLFWGVDSGVLAAIKAICF